MSLCLPPPLLFLCLILSSASTIGVGESLGEPSFGLRRAKLLEAKCENWPQWAQRGQLGRGASPACLRLSGPRLERRNPDELTRGAQTNRAQSGPFSRLVSRQTRSLARSSRRPLGRQIPVARPANTGAGSWSWGQETVSG